MDIVRKDTMESKQIEDHLQEFFNQYVNESSFSNNAYHKLRSTMSYFQKVVAMVNVVFQAKKSSVLRPFSSIPYHDQVYRLYVQPLMFTVAVVAFIVMTYYTRKDKCFKSYVLTVTFLLCDIIGMLLPLPFHFAFLPFDPKSMGLEYRWCEPFRVFVTFLPQAFFYHSQWLKFVACLYECLAIYNPRRAEWLYRKRVLTTLLMITFLVATVLSSLMQYDVDFQRFWYYDRINKDVVDTCIMVPSPIYDVDSKSYNLVRIVAPMTIGIVVPMVFIAVGGAILIYEFTYKPTTNRESSKNTKRTSNHAQFVAATSALYFCILVPRLVFELIIVDDISRDNFNGSWPGDLYTVSQMAFHLSVPATTIIYFGLKRKAPDATESDSQSDASNEEEKKMKVTENL